MSHTYGRKTYRTRVHASDLTLQDDIITDNNVRYIITAVTSNGIDTMTIAMHPSGIPMSPAVTKLIDLNTDEMIHIARLDQR